MRPILLIVLASLACLGSTDPAAAHGVPRGTEMRAFSALTGRSAAKKPLRGVHVIGRQHLDGATRELTEALIAAGVERSNVALLGKTYSEHPETVRALRQMGVRTATTGQLAKVGRTLLGYSRLPTSFEEQVAKQLAHVPNDGSKILVIDDGGELLHMIDHTHPELLPRIVAVEQTRRGARVLQKMDLKVPVIDVAQSEAKLTHEAPMIGRSIARTAQRKLDELAAQGVRPGKRLLLVGYGVVGGAAARAFREAGYAVSTWDESPAARDAARKDGMRPHATKEEALGAADIIVSATGTTALGSADLERVRDGAILMNAASGSHEIRAGEAQHHDPHFIGDTRGNVYSRFRGKPLRLGHASHPSRTHVVLRTAGGRELLLLNDGYVINFDNQEHPTPARYIQLTMGLLYNGALQAVKHRGGPGLHPLAAEGQRAWVDEVKRDLSERGESLERPTF